MKRPLILQLSCRLRLHLGLSLHRRQRHGFFHIFVQGLLAAHRLHNHGCAIGIGHIDQLRAALDLPQLLGIILVAIGKELHL